MHQTERRGWVVNAHANLISKTTEHNSTKLFGITDLHKNCRANLICPSYGYV
jgi:hypothetical protein